MRFRPCIDLHDGLVKQIVGGTLTDSGAQTNFIAKQDSVYFAKLYQAHNLCGGHVIMLGKGNEDAALQALGAYPGGLQLGGGVTSSNAKHYLDAGASKVIVTSFVFSDGMLNTENLKEIKQSIGPDKLVLDLSCRKRDGKYFIVTDRWQKFTDLEVNAETLDYLAGFAAEFLIHAVDVEGKQSGVDADLLALMGKFSPVESTYAGGVASMADIDRVKAFGCNRVDYTIGSALDIFGGKLSFELVRQRNESKR